MTVHVNKSVTVHEVSNTLGRGIGVHTPMFLDFMCIKYIAGIGRNQDALNSSAPDNTKMVDIKGIEPLILPFINIQQQRLYAYEGGCSAIEL